MVELNKETGITQDARIQKPTVLAVVGATASGKTSLGVQLAKRLQGEIISVDSMQIYKGLDVGTAKVTPLEMEGVLHHCVDILEPDESFSVADFVEMAQRLVTEIHARGNLPILVGGTGQYLESFLKGMRFSTEKRKEGLREQLAERLANEGAQAMYDELYGLDKEAALRTHPNNTVRVLRALEHYYTTGTTISAQNAASLPQEAPYHSLVLGLDFKERAVLYDRINYRVGQMVAQGILDEAALVYAHKETYKTAAQAIGYKEYFPYLEGTESLAVCTEKLQQASRKYAKRQLTWLRHMQEIHWLDATDADVLKQAEELSHRFLAGEVLA